MGVGLQSLGQGGRVVQSLSAFNPGSRVLVGLWLGPTFGGWSPLQKVRAIQQQNLGSVSAQQD